MLLEIYKVDLAHFLSGSWQAALKKTKVKVNLQTNIDMLLVVEKGIRGGICHAIPRYAKANNKCTKDYEKNKESLYLKYRCVNSIYGWEMSQKLRVGDLKWVKIHLNLVKNL